jgi:hypothetical protein
MLLHILVNNLKRVFSYDSERDVTRQPTGAKYQIAKKLKSDAAELPEKAKHAGSDRWRQVSMNFFPR